jgi:hypothetical protein
MSRSSEQPAVDLSELTSRHANSVDKWYRMCAGMSSSIVALDDDSYELRVEMSDRVPPEKREQMIFNISKAWSRLRELAHCRHVRVRVYRTQSPQGFMVAPDKSSDDPMKALAAVMMAQFKRMRESEKLPKPFYAEYVGEHPLEDRAQFHKVDRTR